MNAWKIIEFPLTHNKTKIGRSNQVLASEITTKGQYPVIDQGQSSIAGYTDQADKVIEDELPVVVFGDHTRCVKYVDFPFVLGGDGTKVLKPREDLFNPKFYYYALMNIKLPNRGYNRHFTLLKEKSIPCPDLEEQRKIAAILGLVQRAIEEQERLIQLITELKKALLQKLFTEGLRGEPQKMTEIGPVPESWVVVRLGDYLTLAQYGISIKGSESGGYALLRMTNQQQGEIARENLQFVTLTTQQFEKFRVDRQDILFNRTNSFELVGRTALFDLDGDFVFASYLIRLRVDPKQLSPRFLNYFMNWEQTQTRLKSIATRAVSQSNISATRLRGFHVPRPSLEEQTETVTYIKNLDSKLLVHGQKKESLSNLFIALLHQLMTARIRPPDLDPGCLETKE